ncbi:hypothetical protein EYF80_007878 [Liparis tanakae]|uniref:Uncharacterized protein n=1 Tax=Liparis tanakae TaxID=230148 RepID=A0A4Z2IUR0_9TELE|nr:hypothetical protein EYF80_007878 [Liparis tanakae]
MTTVTMVSFAFYQTEPGQSTQSGLQLAEPELGMHAGEGFTTEEPQLPPACPSWLGTSPVAERLAAGMSFVWGSSQRQQSPCNRWQGGCMPQGCQ